MHIRRQHGHRSTGVENEKRRGREGHRQQTSTSVVSTLRLLARILNLRPAQAKGIVVSNADLIAHSQPQHHHGRIAAPCFSLQLSFSKRNSWRTSGLGACCA
jgi:hypothetical protein